MQQAQGRAEAPAEAHPATGSFERRMTSEPCLNYDAACLTTHLWTAMNRVRAAGSVILWIGKYVVGAIW